MIKKTILLICYCDGGFPKGHTYIYIYTDVKQVFKHEHILKKYEI